jgi:hypothetical protein
LKTKFVKPAKLSPAQIARMLQIMNTYYADFSAEQFHKDLNSKDEVIMLLDEAAADYNGVCVEAIAGFSTLLARSMMVGGQKIISLFSGDTVLEKKYWGNGALATAFGVYMIRMRIKHFLTPVYWFLMSKGYKTYLLMTNNFLSYYPRFDRQTPAPAQELIDSFYNAHFAERFNAATGVVRAVNQSGHLKVTVADIEPSLLAHPRIKFFADKNPGWQSGDELACVARVSLLVPVRHSMKRLWRRSSLNS